jgi:hypothetical protein
MLQILTRTNVILAEKGMEDREIVVRLAADESKYFSLQTIQIHALLSPNHPNQL